MDEALHVAGDRLQDIFKMTWDACLIFNSDWRLTSLNKTAEKLFGYSTTDPPNVHFKKLLKKRIGSLFLEVKNNTTRGNTFRDEAICICKEGDAMPVFIKASPFQLAHCEVYVVVIKEAAPQLVLDNNQILKSLSYKVGAGQVATGVLHNIGNILNSINISIQSLSEMAKNSKIPKLIKANELFHENKMRIGEYITNDKAGRHLPDFYAGIGEFMKEDNAQLKDELDELKDHLNLVKELIATQQNYAKCFTGRRRLPVMDLLTDALKIEKMSIQKHKIRVDVQCPDEATIFVEKPKALHVLVNLIKNGIEAILAAEKTGHFQINVAIEESHVAVTIRDNGIGLCREQLAKMFSFGFTTKLDGHGFGLFTSYQLMKEMDGKIAVSSEGLRKGAVFHLEFPKHEN